MRIFQISVMRNMAEYDRICRQFVSVSSNRIRDEGGFIPNDVIGEHSCASS